MSVAAGSARPTSAGRPALTCAFGGGGPFGIAYAFGIVDVLASAGAPIAEGSMLGTSAGSWVAGCLATATPFEALATLPPVQVPNRRREALLEMTRAIFGDARSTRVRTSAIRLTTGRRTLLDGGTHRLADIVAASSAVPYLFAPVRIDGRRYIDGGVRSLVSADEAPAADHLLVVAPIAGPMFGPGGQTMEVLLRREIRRWQDRTGGKAHLVRPNRALADLARNPLDLFDSTRIPEVNRLAREQAARLLETRSGIADICAAGLRRAA